MVPLPLRIFMQHNHFIMITCVVKTPSGLKQMGLRCFLKAAVVYPVFLPKLSEECMSRRYHLLFFILFDCFDLSIFVEKRVAICSLGFFVFFSSGTEPFFVCEV